MKNTDIAWAAGFFDGEGSILLKGSNLRVSIGQKVREPLDRFSNIFKIGTTGISYRKYKSQPYPIFILSIYSLKAEAVLRVMLPYLTVKKLKALEVLNRKKHKSGIDNRGSIVYQLHLKGLSFTIIGKMMGVSRQRAHQLYLSMTSIPPNSQLSYLNYFFNTNLTPT